jgi:hypothetical protein
MIEIIVRRSGLMLNVQGKDKKNYQKRSIVEGFEPKIVL